MATKCEKRAYVKVITEPRRTRGKSDWRLCQWRTVGTRTAHSYSQFWGEPNHSDSWSEQFASSTRQWWAGKMLQILRLWRNRLHDLTSEYGGFPPTNTKDRLKRKCESLSHVWLFVILWTVSPPGSSIHGILQVRIPEWVAFHFSTGSSPPRDQTQVSWTAGGVSTTEPPGGAQITSKSLSGHEHVQSAENPSPGGQQIAHRRS